MFTFGRDHEKKVCARYVRNPEQVPLLDSVIDAVHDLIEGKGSERALRDAIRTAFTEGGSGVWENTESWLRKASADYPGLLQLWAELAAHPKTEVRFRVACVLNLIPEPCRTDLAIRLKSDNSKKVSAMASDRLSLTATRSAT